MKKQFIKSIAAAFVALAVSSGGDVTARGTGGGAVCSRKKTIAATRAHSKIVRVKVSKDGFSPSSTEVEKGYPVTMIFTREDDDNCGSTIVFPALKIRKSLPVGKEIVIKFTPTKTGDVAFTCGMKMYKGKIVVTEADE